MEEKEMKCVNIKDIGVVCAIPGEPEPMFFLREGDTQREVRMQEFIRTLLEKGTEIEEIQEAIKTVRSPPERKE